MISKYFTRFLLIIFNSKSWFTKNSGESTYTTHIPTLHIYLLILLFFLILTLKQIKKLLFWATPGNAVVFFLALYSRINPSRVQRGLHEMPRIEPGLVMCKANSFTVLFLEPPDLKHFQNDIQLINYFFCELYL